MTLAIRERYGMQDVNMDLGQEALRQQKTRKENPPTTHTHMHTHTHTPSHTHIHTSTFSHTEKERERGGNTHPTSPPGIAHRMLAAPTGKIAAALSNMYEYSPCHLFLAVIPRMWYWKPKTKNPYLGGSASCDQFRMDGRTDGRWLGGTGFFGVRVLGFFVFFLSLFSLSFSYFLCSIGLDCYRSLYVVEASGRILVYRSCLGSFLSVLLFKIASPLLLSVMHGKTVAARLWVTRCGISDCGGSCPPSFLYPFS